LSTTLGRDKLYQAIQSFSRLYAWYLLSRGSASDAAPWNALKSHLALGRRLFRLGKPLEHLQALLSALQTRGETGEQITTIAKQLSYFGFLTYDSIIWADAVKFIKLNPITSVKVNKMANRYWFSGILFSLVHSLIKARRLTNEKGKLQSPAWNEKHIGDAADRDTKSHALRVARAATHRQLIIDILDVWTPASGLGLVNVNDGVMGIFGLISSAIALQTQWKSLSGKH